MNGRHWPAKVTALVIGELATVALSPWLITQIAAPVFQFIAEVLP